MGSPGWFNDNSFRSYPLQFPSTLPDEVIVDMGIILGVSSDFDVTTDKVYLSQMSHSFGNIVFTFRITSAFAADQPLVFVCPLANPRYSTYFIDASPTPDDSLACEPYSLWEGFLTTGDLSNLVSTLFMFSNVVDFADTDNVLEPGLIQDLGQRRVRSINLANIDRTRTTTTTAGHVYPNISCLQGDVTLVEGYNASIRQDDSNNSITIGAVVGAGAGQACEEVKLFDAETPPAGSQLLEGGPTCQEVLQTINGISATNFQLFPGPGISIKEDSNDPHGLRISVDLTDFALCGATTGSLGAG